MQRVALARRVADARARKIPWPEIAKQEEQPERTLQYLHRDYLAHQEIHEDGVKAVTETLSIFTEAMTELGDLSHAADNDSARVAAIRTLLDAAKGRLELLAALGRLPRQLGGVEAQRDIGLLVSEMARVIERHNLGDEVVKELIGVLDTIEGEAREIEP